MSDRHRERDPQWATRALQEFMAVPLLMIAGFVALAVITIVLDQSHADWLHGARRALEHLVGQGAAQSSLSAIATGLVTVTSITFSVLLLAVQQAAASLSPVVFDQFVRRRVNQVYVGFFVGLSIYSYVVLAAVQKDTPPTLGASLAVLLTVIALFILLALVYSTLNQMRPVNVIRAIRAHALNARSGELGLLGRTRREARQSGPPDATVTAPVSGYVMSVALAGIGPVLERTPEAELELAVVLGDYVSAGQPVGFVRGAGPDGERLAAAAAHCVVIGKQRDPDVDPAKSVDQLANIAWSSASSAKHSPEIAAEGTNALRDLLSRWADDEQPSRPTGHSRALAVVYHGDDGARIIDAMLDLLVAAHESQQQQTTARVLDAFALTLPRLQGRQLRRATGGLQQAAPMVGERAGTPRLLEAGVRIADALEQAGCAPAAQTVRDAFGQRRQRPSG